MCKYLLIFTGYIFQRIGYILQGIGQKHTGYWLYFTGCWLYFSTNYTYSILIVTILNAKMLAGIIFIILTIGIVAPIIIAIVAYIVAIIDNATKDER